MSAAPLPPEIEVIEHADGRLLYRLPARPIGAWRLLGLAPLLFGLAFGGFAVFWMAMACGVGQGREPDACSMAFAAFGLPFLLGGLSIMGLGILILASHSEVELRGDKLYAIDRWGPIRYARKRAIGEIRRFALGRNFRECREASTAPELPVLPGLAALMVQCSRTDRHLLLAMAYPPELLGPLAGELARRCNLIAEDPAADFERQPAVPSDGAVTNATPQRTGPIDVVEESDEEPAEEPVPLTQPEESDIEVEEAADGVTLTVPPSGLRRTHGLFFFSMLWNGFMVVFTGAAVAGGAFRARELWILIPVLLLFWGVGIGLLLAAVNIGRRRSVLAVVGDELLAMQTGIFGGKRQRWQRDEIRDIDVGPSGVEINDVPVMELQIHPTQGTKFGMLGSRDPAELHWLAGKVRQALRLKRRSVEEVFRTQTDRPESSTAILERQVNGVTLTVPRLGLFRGSWGFLGMGSIFGGAGIGVAVLPFFIKEGYFFLIPFGSIFAAIGLAVLLVGLHMGLRRAVLAVVGDELLVLTSGIFGSKRHHWRRADLRDICPGPSGISSNNQPYLELQIHPKNGDKVGLLAGRDHAELGWMATVLRKELHLE